MSRRDRKREIIKAAEKLFTLHRFHEVTTDDVARDAKVGKGTIYKYFRDKDDLFFETANYGLDELCATLEAGAARKTSFDDELVAACTRISAFFRKKRQLFAGISVDSKGAPLAPALHSRWLERRKQLIAAVASVVKRGVEEGHIRDDVEPEVLAAFLLGMLRVRGRELSDAPEASKRHEFVVDLFRTGANAPHRP